MVPIKNYRVQANLFAAIPPRNLNVMEKLTRVTVEDVDAKAAFCLGIHNNFHNSLVFTEVDRHASQLILRKEKEGARWCRWSSKPVWGP